MDRNEEARCKGSEARLWELIEERMEPGADRERIDQRIWDLFGDDWAVVYTDLAGFSRQVAAFGIIHFLQIILAHKRLLFPIVADHDGILIKVEADSFMMIFRRADKALRCAIAMQHACQRHDAERPPEEQVRLCVGVGYGRILRIGDLDVYGQEVNTACKLGEDVAQRDEILVTQAVRDRCADIEGLSFEKLAEVVAGTDNNFRVIYPDA